MSSGSAETLECSGEWPEGLDYRLPRRDFGRGRFLLWSVMLLLLALAYWLVAGPIERLIVRATFATLIVVCIWCFVAVQLWRYPCWFILGLLFGQREIELRSASLRAGERVGWLRRTKTWPLQHLRRLQVVNLLPSVPADASAGVFAQHLHVLTGVINSGRRIVIAPFYPRALLDPLVQELSKQIALAPRANNVELTVAADEQSVSDDEQTGLTPALDGTSPFPDARAAVEAAPPIGMRELLAEVQGTINHPLEPVEYSRPPGSRVRVEWFPEGITIRIPPVGVWRGSAGLFQFGIIWTIGVAGFTAMGAGALFLQGPTSAAVIGALVILGFFWLVGAALLYFGWNMGMSESVVAVAGDSLMVMQSGLRGAKRKEWPLREITTAKVGPSGIEVNDRAVPQLQIHGADKQLFGMLTGRDEHELIWIATMLRQALKNRTEPSAEHQPADDGRLLSDPAKPPAPAEPKEEFDYHGMTIEERLLVARLSETFADAVQAGDRPAMLDILRRVQLPQAGAEAYAEALLAGKGR